MCVSIGLLCINFIQNQPFTFKGRTEFVKCKLHKFGQIAKTAHFKLHNFFPLYRMSKLCECMRGEVGSVDHMKCVVRCGEGKKNKQERVEGECHV